MMDDLIWEWEDASVLSAASWRLASELVRRHPTTVRLIIGHPGGGQYDVLWLRPMGDAPGNVPLNRNGTIQIHERFDGRPIDPAWQMVSWKDYLTGNSRAFLGGLERAAGLPAPSQVPGATPRTLTYRILASLAATSFKTINPISIDLWVHRFVGLGGRAKLRPGQVRWHTQRTAPSEGR